MPDFHHDDEALQFLFWKDEILQIMYWMKGEGLQAEVSAEQLCQLLQIQAEQLAPYLERLTQEQLLESEVQASSVAYRLSEVGRKEAGKRFADAFQGLQKAGHGECGPECDCQWEGHDSCQHHHHSH